MFPDPTGTIEATDEALVKAARYLEINRMLDSLKEEKETLRDEFSLIFAEHDILTCGKRVVATFKSKPWSNLDQARLKEERPDIYEEYLNKGDSRTLLVKKK
jgi:predicted phage-related endonuclease